VSIRCGISKDTSRDRSREESRRARARAPIDESRDHSRVDRSRICGTRVNRREENITASDSSRL
jgi:hypothetical protein